MREANRIDHLLDAQSKALELLAHIEEHALIAIGKTETEVAKEIFAAAQAMFGIKRRWHKEIVRSGENTTATFSERREDRRLAVDDLVFIDLGPVFNDWEADIGRTYLLGSDTEKQRLIDDLPIVFNEIASHLRKHPNITGAGLYAFAVKSAERRGWIFGGKIAGHIVGEFAHFQWAGRAPEMYISPENDTPLSDPDKDGRTRYWIIEVHLLSKDKAYGGFYEQLAISEYGEDRVNIPIC